MAGKLSEEDYWNSSSRVLSFSFDDDVPSNSFYSLEDSLEVKSSTSIFGSNADDNAQTTLPIHSVITKRNLDAVLEDVRVSSQASVPSVQEVIIKMFLGMPYMLYSYRTLSQKLELLDEALATEDGNVILAILLHLKKTLKLPVLYHHLSKKKLALRHYVSYLKQESKLEELADLYMATGNFADIVYIFHISRGDITIIESLHRKLMRFLAEHQSRLDQDKAQLFLDYKHLMEWQLENNLNANSAVEQLAALFKSELEKQRDNNKGIVLFKQTFKINDFQYEWIQLNVYAAFGKWKKLSELFIKPNWLTKKNSYKSAIDVQLFISRLHKHNAPKEVLEEFLTCVVDNDLSLNLAKKMKCHKFVIGMYITQRDRISLMNYKETIPGQSEDYFYADNALRSSDKKWKN